MPRVDSGFETIDICGVWLVDSNEGVVKITEVEGASEVVDGSSSTT